MPELLAASNAGRSGRRRTQFAAGDRVKERGRPGMDVVDETSANFELVSRFRHHPRQGQVVSLAVKPDRAGRRCVYVNVLWDGFSTPSQHAASRLVLL